MLATFVLIVVGLAVLLLVNWLVLEPAAQRSTDATRAAREVHEGLLMQESALRAYVLTGDESFLRMLREGEEMTADALPDVDRLGHSGRAAPLLLETRLAQEAWTDRWVPRALEAAAEEIEGSVAAMPTHARTGSELVHAADAALYAAKRNGRNQVVVANPPT